MQATGRSGRQSVLCPVGWAYLNPCVDGRSSHRSTSSASRHNSAVLSIHGVDEYVTVTPDPVAGRVLPEALVVATAGFLLGVALRSVRPPRTAGGSTTLDSQIRRRGG